MRAIDDTAGPDQLALLKERIAVMRCHTSIDFGACHGAGAIEKWTAHHSIVWSQFKSAC
jgi:hypothetical protein